MKAEVLHQAYFRPQNEGANIENYIGFKHLTYLMEETIINYFREKYLSPNQLLRMFGVKFYIKSLKIDILKAVNIDDEIVMKIFSPNEYPTNRFKIKASDNSGILFFKGELVVCIDKPIKDAEFHLVSKNFRYLLKEMVEKEATDNNIELPINNSNPIQILKEYKSFNSAFIFSKRIPYYYCNYTDELHHSGYERIIEEAVDLFLEERGMSIRTMLNSKRWIPVVSKSQIEIKHKIKLEDTIYIAFSVKNIVLNSIYEADIYFFKQYNNKLIEVANGSITHGYSCIKNPETPELVIFDELTLKKLSNEKY